MSSFPILSPPFSSSSFPKHMWPNHYLLRTSIPKSFTQAADEVNFPFDALVLMLSAILVALIFTSFFSRLLRVSRSLFPFKVNVTPSRPRSHLCPLTSLCLPLLLLRSPPPSPSSSFFPLVRCHNQSGSVVRAGPPVADPGLRGDACDSFSDNAICRSISLLASPTVLSRRPLLSALVRCLVRCCSATCAFL